LKSSRFPIGVIASRSRATLAEEYGDMFLLARLGMAAFGFMVLGFLWVAIRRNHDDPVAALRRAIADGEIVPFYQPIVDLNTGHLRGAEALARWRRSDGTMISPASFIPLAERSGLIYELTRSMMRRMRQDLEPALALRPQLHIAFNLHAGHFSGLGIVKDVTDIFEASQISLSQLIFEVTEREPVANLDEARQVISALQALGCGVAIDDVGSGHSGLSYMLKLGVNYIKIDKIFVDAIGIERFSQTIIETLVELARCMDLHVVAEGVETLDQVDILRAKGIVSAQGFVFAPALPASSFLALVEAMEKPQVGPITHLGEVAHGLA
jgi:sensor c-di-GMP phosphodiesterase-like protein